MIYSHQISDRKTVTHSFDYLFTCHREKLVFEEEMQTIVLKKNHENSNFLTSEFHSGCKKNKKNKNEPIVSESFRHEVSGKGKVAKPYVTLNCMILPLINLNDF